MRILLTSHYALPHVGGIETAVDGFARELTRRGHDVVHVASNSVRDDDPPAAGTPPYELIRVPALNTLECRARVPWPLFSPRLVSVLRPHIIRADVVHAHGYLYLSSLAALALSRRTLGRPRRVLTEHVGQVPYDSSLLGGAQTAAAETLGRATVRAADGLVALNQSVDRELARLAPRTPRRIIGNGVDAGRHRPADGTERSALRSRLGWDDAPRALFVGRLVAKKGLDVVVQAAERDPSLRLVVAGPGRPPPGLPPNVEVVGALAPDEVRDLYRAADVFVLPSRGEGFPITVQEAMASGLPVVLGHDDAYEEALRGAGAAVRTVKPEPRAVLEALTPLLHDSTLREQAAAAAVRHARDHYAWHAIVEDLLAFYAELRPRDAQRRRPRG